MSYLNTEFLSAFQASKLQGGLCYIGVSPRAELSSAFQALGIPWHSLTGALLPPMFSLPFHDSLKFADSQRLKAVKNSARGVTPVMNVLLHY
jgi:hypothetical protein